MKFNNEQLSRILTAHCNHELVIFGETWNSFTCPDDGCINQHAYNVSTIGVALIKNLRASTWFDINYNEEWTVDEFVSEMTKAGLI